MGKLKVCLIYKTIKLYTDINAFKQLTSPVCDCKIKCEIGYDMKTYYNGIFNNIKSSKFWNEIPKNN